MKPGRLILPMLLIALTLTCEAPTGWEPPVGTEPLQRPYPAEWRALWDYAKTCPGVDDPRADFDRLTFYVVPDSSLVWDGTLHAGGTDWRHHRVYLERTVVEDGPTVFYQRFVVVHEMWHDLLHVDNAPIEGSTAENPGCDMRVP